jgi:drug/metabolite transporter (DMT)-like permease
VALLSGFLDAGGNILYLFATQNTRLDIAALLSSLYPAATVLLSSLILKEKSSLTQWFGVGACIVAIMLITTG